MANSVGEDSSNKLKNKSNSHNIAHKWYLFPNDL